MTETIPFNKWSQERIDSGRKICTSRKRIWDDPRVTRIEHMFWGDIKAKYYREEGADSPEELQKVVNKIFRRVVEDTELFYIHFGKFGGGKG